MKAQERSDKGDHGSGVSVVEGCPTLGTRSRVSRSCEGCWSPRGLCVFYTFHQFYFPTMSTPQSVGLSGNVGWLAASQAAANTVSMAARSTHHVWTDMCNQRLFPCLGATHAWSLSKMENMWI